MAKIVECACGIEFWTSKDDTDCPRCIQNSKPTTYGLRFYAGVAEPTQEFWQAWRADRDHVKRQGFVPQKQGSGRWKVKRLEIGEKARAKTAIEQRYSRSNKFGM